MLIPADKISPSKLLFDPEHYIFDISNDLESCKFLLVDEEYLAKAPFIDIRFEPLAKSQFWVSTDTLINIEKQHRPSCLNSVFIFHHAFVCSTLLARCLNQIENFFSLKEPWILRRLSDIKRRDLNNNKWSETFQLSLRLLEKRYQQCSTPVIKATNIANNLITDLLMHKPNQKILYMYSDLESFLVSNIKKPRETQQKMLGLLLTFLKDSDFSIKYIAYCELDKLSFLQICSLVWAVNLYNFMCSTKYQPSDNIKTLAMHDFLGDMNGTLKRLSVFFKHHATDYEINKMMDPSVIQTNAKQQQLNYGQKEKQKELQHILKIYRNDINHAKGWVNNLLKELNMIEYMQSLKL